MIFLSHNHKDKIIVEQVALKLEGIFGRENIFYDSWSMQPGDGIIDKMSEGLGKCKLFLFFVSKNSLQSNMVKLEWQNALLRATQGNTKIIPVKMDDCMMPPILLQTLYIDLFGQGLETAIRQIIDVASGQNTFKPGPQTFSNLRAYTYEENDKIIIECRAEFYLEPITHFLIVVQNDENELSFQCKSSSMHLNGFHKDLMLGDGRKRNAQFMGIERGTVPGFPFIIEIVPRNGFKLLLDGVMHEKKQNYWEFIPLTSAKPVS